MHYKMNVWICNPNPEEGMNSDLFFSLDCVFVHNEKDYGNGYHVGIEGKGWSGIYYDIRYDTSFHPKRKEAWLADWAYNYWSGENGAYKVKRLEITEV